MQHERAVEIAEASANSPTSASFEGRWRNQIGSTMELHVADSDVIGSYTSVTSGQGAGGQITGQLKGWTAGDLIAFSVLWPGGSITSWTGQLVNEGGQKIRTLWQLVTDIPDVKESDRLWQSTLAGADEFTRA